MKNLKYLLFSVALCALVVVGVGAIRDENGTIRYRNGARQTYDASTSIADEDGAWSMNNASLFALSTIAAAPSIQTFASASNSVATAIGGASYLLMSDTPVSLTNCTGATAGYLKSADITVSNSSGATYTNFCTIPNAIYVGANGVNQNSNAVTIAATKQAFWHIQTQGTSRTNVSVKVEQ